MNLVRSFMVLGLVFVAGSGAQAAGEAAACMQRADVSYTSCRRSCAGDGWCGRVCGESKARNLAACPGQPNAAEQRVLDLTNQERRNLGFNGISWDLRLGEAAQGHSTRQAVTGISEHVLEGKSPQDRIRASGFPAAASGENIYWGQGAGFITPEAAVRWWMNSSAHRANILNRDWGYLGVGIRQGTAGKWYFTQNFGRL